jgi:penicillin-binding protein 1C
MLAAAGLHSAVEATRTRLGPAPLEAAARVSATVVDRHGRLLRAFTTSEGRWRLPADVNDVDPRYLAILKAFEDHRFERHYGVDVIGMTRAVWQLVSHLRLVSGGSTLTMQVARLLDGDYQRTPYGKWRQMVRALELEQRLTKTEIMNLYLRLAPFGGNIEGVRAASLAYFGKEPRRLSVGEAALLVALPQSPETRRPDRSPEAARRARDRVLARAVEVGVISKVEAERAMREAVPRSRREFPKFAPHLSEAEHARDPALAVNQLTIDRDAQAALEGLVHDHARALGDKLSAAILAVENRTGEIVAYVGSADYFDDTRLGAVDMVRAVRSPGSTLKPIIYGLGFEAGIAHPETLIEDRPVRFGTYAPKNFDEDFRGTVTIREALAHSLNIPAVKVLNAVGPGRLVGRFRRVGLAGVLPPETPPSLPIALGGIGLRLWDLTQLYAGLANGGEVMPLRYRGEAARPKGRAQLPQRARRVLSPVAAWYVTDILKDAPPPASAKGGRIAYKTGTSYGYRDAWAIGYDGRHTIAVWVGRPDSTATPSLTGRTAAAPILFDAFQRLSVERTPLPAPPSGVLRVSGSDLPPPLKRFAEPGDTEPEGAFLEPPVQIAFPPDRSELELDDPDSPVVLKAEGGALPLTWIVEGAPLAVDGHRRETAWQPDGRGFVRVSVIDARGRVDRVTVRLK